MSFPDSPTFAIRTVGCKVNQYESQAMREALRGRGFIEVKDAPAADFYIINSCTVTGKADRETRNLIHRFHRTNPSGKVLVAGCYAEADRDRKTLAGLPGVAGLVRNTEKGRIAEIVSELFPSPAWMKGVYLDKPGMEKITRFENRNRAFVKIQDGCDHRCSYCKVGLVRGPSRSRAIGEIKEEVNALAAKGFKEIVLTGICLGAWVGTGFGLPRLLKEISRSEGGFRIRLSSIEPIYVTGGLIDELRENDNVCKHLHIPLQSGDDTILRLMRRPYSTKKYLGLVTRLRKRIPDIALTTDVLVGFPGEGKAHFKNTLRFINEIRPSRMHVFCYSKREGTPAAKLAADPDKKTAKERARILTELGKGLSMDFAGSFIGKIQNVVIENHRDGKSGFLTGYTGRYVRVLVDGPDSLKNKLAAVRITAVGREKNAVLGRLDNREII
jgi:threonylcarbamoyladenosine tRNA methylthiotransferase MtaB